MYRNRGPIAGANFQWNFAIARRRHVAVLRGKLGGDSTRVGVICVRVVCVMESNFGGGKMVDWWRRRKQQVTLTVMCVADMWTAHPNTDYSHVCSKCREPVGIYPSGQRVLRRYKSTTIVCNRCADPGQVGVLAPGALREPMQSKPINRQ